MSLKVIRSLLLIRDDKTAINYKDESMSSHCGLLDI